MHVKLSKSFWRVNLKKKKYFFKCTRAKTNTASRVNQAPVLRQELAMRLTMTAVLTRVRA